MRDEGDITRMLAEIRREKHDNLDLLLPVVYAELQRLARCQLRGERRDPTLQTSDPPAGSLHPTAPRLTTLHGPYRHP